MEFLETNDGQPRTTTINRSYTYDVLDNFSAEAADIQIRRGIDAAIVSDFQVAFGGERHFGRHFVFLGMK